MSLSDLRFWAAGVLVAVILPFGSATHGQPTPAKRNKVLVYPTGTESVSQLKECGIDRVLNYGSYWLVEATDDQMASLKASYGKRAMKADYLNRVELGATPLDTTVGEPTIPSHLQQSDTAGKRLRLVQFQGPIQPQWMKQLEGAGKVVSYIPNNTYVVWLDQDGEAKLKTQLVPDGPIQWIGRYHPYYKIQKSLLTAEPGEQGGTVEVSVAVVANSETAQTAGTIQALGSVRKSYELAGQKVFELSVPQSAVSQIAQLPNVIWIEKVEPKQLFDEKQDLLLASQTNQLPGHAPMPPSLGGIHYLDFLTNTVGGGLASFTNQFAYPIVDIADTGLDTATPYYPTTHPAFYEFGSWFRQSRVAYARPHTNVNSPPFDSYLGCAPLNLFFYGWEDFCGHGTFVASIIAGYDDQPNEAEVCIYQTTELRPYDTGTITCLGNGQITTNWCFPTWVPPCGATDQTTCTNITFACFGAGDTNFTVLLPTCVTVTQEICIAHRDQPLRGCTNFFDTAGGTNIWVAPPGEFQLGLGVSPFGRIGATRIFSQSAHTQGSPCSPVIDPCVYCNNDLLGLIQQEHENGARIANNSWGEALGAHAENSGQYHVSSLTYDVGVRDALLSGSANTPGPFPLNQEFIVVFAAGNAGSADSVGGFGDVQVTAPATAKNVMSVGASENVRLDGSGCMTTAEQDNSFDVSGFSSFGPTDDGRFKPEILAPGASVYGAVSQLALGVLPDCTIIPVSSLDECGYVENQYTCGAGTSFSAPAVSGGMQLLWWYFENRLTNEVGHALLQPSPAMAKAYLCNAARYLPVTNPQYGTMDTLPSIAQGMGEMDLQRMFDGVPRVIRDESTPRAIDAPLITTNPASQQTYFSQSGQSYEVSGQVFSNGLPFRVTVAWTDAPGNPVAAFVQLVNDLDLSVTIGGQTYKGNVFAEDHSVVGGAYDGVNNMESVFLPPGQTGTWKVVVQAWDIAGDGVPNVGSSLGQDFALVVYNSQTNFATLSDVPNRATNNSCQTAMVITESPFSFSNTLSTNVYHNVHPSPSAGRGGADEFFKLNLPTPGGVFTVNTTGSSFDNVLSVWRVQVVPQTVFVRGECGALVEVASNAGGLSSAVTFTADGTNDYYIVVEPHNDGPGGTMVLNVSATAPAIAVTPSTLVFPDQIVGLTSAVQTVTYRNNTPVKVTISSVSITGSNAADFVIESQGCAGMGPGQNCNISIAFAPTTNGLRTAQLVINDDATGSPRIVPLSGNGLMKAPVVCVGGSLAFGSVFVGSTSAVQSVTITNCGSAALFITNIVVSGTAYSNYIISSNTCSGNSISSGGTCTFGVSFAPSTNGLRSAVLTIDNSAASSPNTVTLTGTGEVPTPQACLSSGSSIAFGNQSSGTTSTVHSVTIINCGTAVLHIYSVSLTGASAGEFILSGDTCSGNDIATNSTCSFGVSFAPTNFTAETASLIISNNSPINPRVVTLTGTGAASQPDLLINKTVKVKTFVGNHIHDPTGLSETITQTVKRGKKGVFYVAIQNDGNTTGSFRIQGGGDSAGFTVKYFLGTKGNVDITSAVEAGTRDTGNMGVGAITGYTTMIRMEVTVSETAAKGTRRNVLVSGVSDSDPSKADAVQAVVLVK